MAILTSATGKGMGQNTLAYSLSAGPPEQAEDKCLARCLTQGGDLQYYSNSAVFIYDAKPPNSWQCTEMHSYDSILAVLYVSSDRSEQSHKPEEYNTKYVSAGLSKSWTSQVLKFGSRGLYLCLTKIDNSIRFVHFLLKLTEQPLHSDWFLSALDSAKKKTNKYINHMAQFRCLTAL